MKKLISFFIISIFLCTEVFANGIDVLPTMMSKSTNPDRVWVGTFQIVWNDFMDKIVHNYVRFKDGTPEIVWELNAKTFSKKDVSKKFYYKTASKISKRTKQKIKKAIAKKFNETSDILDSLELTPNPNTFIIYAMLKKDFEFLYSFDKLGKSSFGEKQEAEYFGIDGNSDSKKSEGVNVLFYNNSDDYAVVLKTKSKDDVYLYKTSADKPFNQIYEDLNKKKNMYKGITYLRKIDELKVPDIKFSEEKNFKELENKRVLGTNITITQAMETVKFEMDNKGVKLKSEASITLLRTASRAPTELPRYYYFDKTFVIFLIEKEKSNPYFALRVNDIEKFQ